MFQHHNVPVQGMSPQSPWSTWESISTNDETTTRIQELERLNCELVEKIQSLEQRNNKSSWKTLHSSLLKFSHRNRNRLLAVPNLTATFLWLTMLLVFLIWYLRQPKDAQGRNPQICESFSLWPYISCIGGHLLPVFRGVCVIMALTISTSFLLLCHLARPISAGVWLRRAAAFFAVMSCCALISLSFESIDEAPTAHLVSTSIQIFAMGNTKFFDWLGNSRVRRAFRERLGKNCRVRPLEVARWLKTCAAAFAAVPAMVTCMGVYYCNDIAVVNDQSSSCNKIVALSAVGEWILSIGWVSYMATIAYDLYHIGVVVEIWELGHSSHNAEEGEEKVKGRGDAGFSHESLQTLLPIQTFEYPDQPVRQWN